MQLEYIKHEFKLEKSQCHTCLTIGRMLTPLGKYVDIFRRIAPRTEYWINSNMESVNICWECKRALHKMVAFQDQVLKAMELLEMGQAYGTLSNLTTVIFSDTSPNTIYITHTKEPTNTVAKSETEDIDTGHVSDSIDNLETIDNTIDNLEAVKAELDVEHKRKTGKVKNNRWALERALLNKKPKFKIINRDKIFKKFRISTEELSSFRDKERLNEFYMASEFKCESCAIGFKDGNCLAKHNEKRHSESAGPYTCDICNSRTTTKRALVKHICNHYYTYQQRWAKVILNKNKNKSINFILIQIDLNKNNSRSRYLK